MFIGRAVSPEYLSVLQSSVNAETFGGSTGLVGDDGNVQVQSSGGSGGSSGASVPSGTIVMHSADVRDPANIPIGWLPCDGRVLSKAGYPTLWSVIGDTYTNRSDHAVASSAFRIPDLRGRYAAGVMDKGRMIDNITMDTLGH